jgi:hypothetical protein
MMLGRLLVAASNIRTGIYTQTDVKFFAANGEIVIAITNPRMVATKAIFNVSSIPMYAFEQKNPKLDLHLGYFLASSILHSGGHRDSFQNFDKFSQLP